LPRDCYPNLLWRSSSIRLWIKKSRRSFIPTLASAWELALKIDRLGWTGRFEPLIQSGIRELRMTILGVNLEHVIYSGSLPWHHRDPFDRLLIAQALLEGVPILTQDPKIAEYSVPTIP
jgi:PIN domain nuclease of toxin-antitoxin system